MTSLLKCFACGDIRRIEQGASTCGCGRSAALVDGSIVEIQGPARLLVPADDLHTVDGVPWTAMPEEPFVVRRSPAARLAS
jgi:hypothetical protein